MSHDQQYTTPVDKSREGSQKGAEKKEAAPKASQGKQELARMRRAIDQRAMARGQQERLKEAREKNETIVWSREALPLGVDRVTAKDRESMPPLRKDFKYRAIGGVDMTPFDPEAKHDAAWYLEKSRLAFDFAELFTNGQIVSNFKRYGKSPDLLNAIDDLARVSIMQKQGDFNAEKFKKELDAKYGKDFLYGAEGIFNLLTAMNRANETVEGKDPGAVLYDLRVGQGRLQKAERFIELREIGPVNGQAAPAAAPEVQAVSTPKLSREDQIKLDLKWIEFNVFLEDYEKDRDVLLADVDTALAQRRLSQKDAQKMHEELKKLDFHHIDKKETEVDTKRMVLIDATLIRIRNVLSKLPAGASVPEGFTGYEMSAKKILNEGNLVKEHYAWPKKIGEMTSEDADTMARRLAEDVVNAVRAPDRVRENLIIFLAGKIRPHISRAMNAQESDFTFEESLKIELVEMTLGDMKTFNLQRMPQR